MSPNEVEQNKYEIISRLRGPTDEDQYDEYLDEIHAHGLGKQPSGYMFYGTGGPDPGQGDVDAFYNTETNSWQDFTDEDTFTRFTIISIFYSLLRFYFIFSYVAIRGKNNSFL